MRRKLHEWFGWHAWAPLTGYYGRFIKVFCKCGARLTLDDDGKA